MQQWIDLDKDSGGERVAFQILRCISKRREGSKENKGRRHIPQVILNIKNKEIH